MYVEAISQPVAEEFRRLRDRFEELSARGSPTAVCLVKTCSELADVRRHESRLWCEPPPEPWLSLVKSGCYEDGDDPRVIYEAYVIQVLIHKATEDDWERLAVSAAHASRLLAFVPRRVWPLVSTYWTAALARTENGWSWFNVVFDLALGPPHPKLLSVDNPDRGGFFWWRDSNSRLEYVGDSPRVMDFIKRDGRYGAVISDMAKQSAIAISFILEQAGVGSPTTVHPPVHAGIGLPRELTRYSKEQKAWWWYRWICEYEKQDLDEGMAYEALQQLASKKEAYVCPPWSSNCADWLSTSISLETFKKYLSRHRLQVEPKARCADASSVVRLPPRDGRNDHDTRAMTPVTQLARHRQAGELRAAEADQAARDAEAAFYGFDIEPPIDSQGNPA